MVLRDLGLEKAIPVVTSVVGRCETSERRGYHVVQVNHDARLDRPDLSFAAGSLARGMKSPTTKDFEKLTRFAPLARTTCWSDHV